MKRNILVQAFCILLIWPLFMGMHPPVKIVDIGVDAGLQFSVVRFTVKPGEKVKLVLNNTDDMSHNLLITQPGMREVVVEETNKLGAEGPSSGYVPAVDEVLWSIPVTAPGESREVEFNAPTEEGVYPYVCTYPGHGTVMYGAMYVTETGELPPLSEDIHVPQLSRSKISPEHTEQGHGHHHPYIPMPPFHYRVFIDGASPAAIAVSLPNNVSYCWDAGTCYLRFAWTGGFLDNSDLWKGKGDAQAIVVGDKFFESDSGFPLVFEGQEGAPEVNYKGYRMINRYPEFHYQLEGVDVFELITPTENGDGIERQFRIPEANTGVIFSADQYGHVKYDASLGEWRGGELFLEAGQAHLFTIKMTKNGGN